MVRLRLIGYVAELMGFGERNIELNRPIRLEDILKFPKELEPERIIIIVNRTAASMNLKIKDEDEIIVMPMLGGG